MSYPIVSVVFRDITATCDWTQHTEVDCLPIEVIGFLVHHGDDTLKLATARTHDGEYSAVTAIPTGCIIKITTLVQTPPEPLSDLAGSEGSVGLSKTGSHDQEHKRPSLGPPYRSLT